MRCWQAVRWALLVVEQDQAVDSLGWIVAVAYRQCLQFHNLFVVYTAPKWSPLEMFTSGNALLRYPNSPSPHSVYACPHPHPHHPENTICVRIVICSSGGTHIAPFKPYRALLLASYCNGRKIVHLCAGTVSACVGGVTCMAATRHGCKRTMVSTS